MENDEDQLKEINKFKSEEIKKLGENRNCWPSAVLNTYNRLTKNIAVHPENNITWVEFAHSIT